MQQRHGGAWLGLLLIIVGGFGLAINFGYLRFSVEMVAAIPLVFGCLLLASVFAGNRSNLFPALLFSFISVPLYLTLAGFDGERFWPLWVLAPGLAFLGTSLLGGPWRHMWIPGTIVSGVGLYFLSEQWWQFDFQLVVSIGLLAIGALLLLNQRRPSA